MAYRKHIDGFGAIVLASVTAISERTLRDVVLDLPVFKGELYATTTILGGVTYTCGLSLGLPIYPAMILAMLVTLLIRPGAIKWH